MLKDGLTKAEEQAVRLAAKALLARLKDEHPKVLVQGWHKDSQSQKKVKKAMEMVLDDNLPDSYGRVEFQKYRDDVFELVTNHAINDENWVAESA